MSEKCACKYPIVLVHGVVIKDFRFFRAFGRIEKSLRALGYRVYTADTDGFGTIESNAVQLKQYIAKVLIKENTDKVNIIAHSKGGLDTAHMINELGGEHCVASLTALCTPFRGSIIATKILSLPRPILKLVAFWLDTCYKIFGDKHPNALAVCNQLAYHPTTEEPKITHTDDIYVQSYSAVLEKKRHDFLMSIPLAFSRHFVPNDSSDGLVAESSAALGDYKGAVDGSISHSQIIDILPGKKNKDKIIAFYSGIAADLADMGL